MRAVPALLPMKTLVGLLAFASAASVQPVTAPRFRLKPGMTQSRAVQQLARLEARTPGASGIACSVYDGNVRTGWRHARCVGAVNAAGTRHRFRLTFTPISCKRVRETLVVSGIGTKTQISRWRRHDPFICRQ